jgi:acetyl-CoA carboxylase biotin carboxyl carrier protein
MTLGIGEDIIAILKFIDSSSCQEVRLVVGDTNLHVQKTFLGDVKTDRPEPRNAQSSAPTSKTSLPISTPPNKVAQRRSEVEGNELTAPMVGVFYRSSAPGADPFVKLGDTVTADTIVCIVEAMKVMNTLKAGTEGKVAEVAVENGELVEYGQRLFTIVPEAR